MKTTSLIHTWLHKPHRLILLGILTLFAFITVKGSFAQNQEQGEGIYLPIIVAEQAKNSAAAHEHLGIGHIPEDGRFTTNDGRAQSWPPQVKYIQDIAWDNRIVEIVASQITAVDAVATTAASDAQIQTHLGERFTFISAQPIQEKWQDQVNGHKVTYFSYSNNITIEAVVVAGQVETVQTFGAVAYQPPLRQNEVENAVAIARRYWQEAGNDRVNELEGFAIQTFRTDGDGGYYDTRMSYVSFHIDERSEPELLTWVDLTTERVIRAAIDEGGVQYEQ